MRIRLLAILFALSLVLSAFALTPQRAGAYYGQIEGYRSLPYAGSSTQGILMQLFVFPWRSVQAYGEFHNGSSGAYADFTNWIEYYCDGARNPYGCTYNILIRAQGAPWHPTGCFYMVKDDFFYQHALIMECGTWSAGEASRAGGFDAMQTYWDYVEED